MKKGREEICMCEVRVSWKRTSSQISNYVWIASWPDIFSPVWTEVYWNIRATIEDQVTVNLKEWI